MSRPHPALPAGAFAGSDSTRTPENTSGTIRTRFLLLSDTHSIVPYEPDDRKHVFRRPLPKADVLLHAGDLTGMGKQHEYERTFEVLKGADAELKIVIAGNHDITLDRKYYPEAIKNGRWPRLFGGRAAVDQQMEDAWGLWTGDEARKHNIVYLEEGLHTFALSNGAKFTIYTSPYSTDFGGWAFAYERDHDRFNPAEAGADYQPRSPVPSWPAVDIVMTHGPPRHHLDRTARGPPQPVGCDSLLTAVKRARPRLHVFGHIHEAYGAQRVDWEREDSRASPGAGTTSLNVEGEGKAEEKKRTMERGFAYIDAGEDGRRPVEWGKESVLVNASIMTMSYRPQNAPWLVDIDLPPAADGS